MGGGGTGKSVVSAELLRRLRARGDVGLAWHFCRHDDAAQSSAGALIRSLSAMLGAAVGDAATFREAREAAAARASDDAAALFDALVAAPLAAALGGAGVSRRVVVVVDALTAGEHELFFWAAKDLETYETAVTHRDYVESLDWTADGRLFASAGDRRRPAAATNSERFRPGKR